MAHKTIDPDVPPAYTAPQPSAFPTELPPRSAPPPAGASGQSWKDRNCPNMRTCWSFSLSSYSLKDVDNATRLRRICMIVILALRTAMSVLSCFSAAANGHIASCVIYALVGALGLWFIAWCLARIGDARGERRVLGVMVGRWHFDVFLLGCAIIHVGLIVAYFFWWSPWGLQLTWLAMWLAIFAVAWIAGWEPEYPASNV